MPERFYIEATWQDGPAVHVTLGRVQPLAPEHAARLIERGMLRGDDEQVGRTQIGEIRITEPPMAMTEKRVRRTALAWLAEHAGMTEEDSYEMRIAVRADLEALARLEKTP